MLPHPPHPTPLPQADDYPEVYIQLQVDKLDPAAPDYVRRTALRCWGASKRLLWAPVLAHASACR